MKSFQLRLSNEVYQTVADLAKRRETTIADVVRNALEVYAIAETYTREGRRVMFEDPATGEKAQLMVPGLTTRRPADRDLQTLGGATAKR